jgi:hypothetical protein
MIMRTFLQSPECMQTLRRLSTATVADLAGEPALTTALPAWQLENIHVEAIALQSAQKHAAGGCCLFLSRVVFEHTWHLFAYLLRLLCCCMCCFAENLPLAGIRREETMQLGFAVARYPSTADMDAAAVAAPEDPAQRRLMEASNAELHDAINALGHTILLLHVVRDKVLNMSTLNLETLPETPPDNFWEVRAAPLQQRCCPVLASLCLQDDVNLTSCRCKGEQLLQGWQHLQQQRHLQDR